MIHKGCHYAQYSGWQDDHQSDKQALHATCEYLRQCQMQACDTPVVDIRESYAAHCAKISNNHPYNVPSLYASIGTALCPA